jgi:hypothetical protein
MPISLTQLTIDDSTDRTHTGVVTVDRAAGGVLVIPAGSSFPGTPVAGELFFRTDEATLYRRNSGDTDWEEVSTTTGIHANEMHDPDMLTVGGNRSDANLDKMTDGDEDNDVDPLHLHMRRDKYRAYLWDDFVGKQVNTNLWNVALNGAGSAQELVSSSGWPIGGVLKLTSGGANGYYAILNGNVMRNWHTADAVFSFRVRVGTAGSNATDSFQQIKLTDTGGSENAVVVTRSGTSGGWKAQLRLAGVTDEKDLSTAVSDAWITFKVVCTASSVKFYVDGTLQATYTTGLPSVLTEIYIIQWTTGGSSARWSYFDWIEIDGKRAGT